MKYLLSLLLIISSFLLACNQTGTSNNPVYGIVHKKLLSQKKIVHGYPCSKGLISYYDNDSIMFFMLSENHRINGDLVPAKSKVTMYFNGKPEFIYLGDEAQIQGYTPKRKKMSHWHVSYYNNGMLSQLQLKNDIVLSGIPVSSEGDFRLYPNGNIWYFTLANDYAFDSLNFKKGDKVILDENGKASTWSLQTYRELEKRVNISKYTKRYYKKATEE